MSSTLFSNSRNLVKRPGRHVKLTRASNMFTSVLQHPRGKPGEKVNGPMQAAPVRLNGTVNLSAFLLFYNQIRFKENRGENQKSVGPILVYDRICVIDTFCHKSEDDRKKKLQKIEATVCRPSCGIRFRNSPSPPKGMF